MGNLNTHSIGSLYEPFPPEEARRIAEKLEIHDTPKHGSWLNVAEIELRVLTVQCLSRRIADAATLRREVTAYEKARNKSVAHVGWQFTAVAPCRARLGPRIQLRSATRSEGAA
jgi:hypothetical protein